MLTLFRMVSENQKNAWGGGGGGSFKHFVAKKLAFYRKNLV